MKFYQVDAFTDTVFKGNPAAVMPLEEWLADDILQKIAGEHNLSETAFFIPYKDGYQLRWFTPTHEVPLCGHATLASSYVIFNHLQPTAQKITFYTLQSGMLTISREGNQIIMDFPVTPVVPNQERTDHLKAILPTLVQAYDSSMLILEFDSEAAVQNFQPDFEAIKQWDDHAIGITARADSSDYDFVSRLFAPKIGINEDPVTGALHCLLVDLWSKKMNKTTFKAKQVSARTGLLGVELIGSRVLIKGQAALVMEGRFYL